MSAGHVSSGQTDSTASWLDPESNHTSRMFISRSNVVPPHDGQARSDGTKSSVGRSYHESAPYCSNTAAVFSTSAGVTIASPHLTQSTAGIGTPHARWREMHQSGRFATMLYMRSWPQGGTHSTSRSTAFSAARRSVVASFLASVFRRTAWSSVMNHCDVARKITGLWQRQQCGY